jgi:hypothetical protein
VNVQSSTAKYIEASGEVFALTLDAFASVGRSRLAYWKSVWEVAARPYAAPTLESSLRESLERANQLADLTVGELRSSAQIAADYSKKLITQIAKAVDSAVKAARESFEYASTVNQEKAAAKSAPVNGSKPQTVSA